MSQMSFADAEYAGKRKKTRREVLLDEMNQVIPCAALFKLIEPFYPVAGQGRRPYPLESMLRVHLMQNFFTLSDPAMEEALYNSASMRQFAGFKLSGAIPDQTTILNFRHLLEEYDLAEDILAQVNKLLAAKGVLLKRGTIVDATIIAAPSSTKNASGERDPEMHQPKKGNQWYFGMKAHIGVDADSGLVHTVTTTAANEADVEQFKASIRAKVEHPFRVVKRQFGLMKVRFRGLQKNTAHLLTLFALSNLWMARGRLMGQVRPKAVQGPKMTPKSHSEASQAPHLRIVRESIELNRLDLLS